METTAEEFLAEIQHETLQDLLLSVRQDVDVGRSLHGGPGDILGNSKDNENKFSRLLARGNVVELQGASGTGKTRLSYEAILLCILPPQFSGVEWGGWGQAAFVLDTDDTFDALHLTEMLRRRIDAILNSNIAHRPRDDLDYIRNHVLQEASRNLHVFRPTSSVQLAATILQLPHYHYEEPHTQHRESGLLVVDSISAFYWQDRFTTEQLRGGQSDPRTPFRHVIAALEQIKRTHRPTILLTNWGLNPLIRDPSAADTSPFFRQHLYPMPPGFDVSLPRHDLHDLGTRPFTREPSRRATPAHIVPEHEPLEGHSRSLSTLSLTHHVTLSRQPPMDADVASSSPEDSSTAPQGQLSEIVGLVRIPDSKLTGQLQFTIHDSRIEFASGDMFRR